MDFVDINLIYSETDFASLLYYFTWTVGLSLLLKAFYEQYAVPLANFNQIGNILLALACTIFLVISVVKTSFALSLGLVGALSIVRFRTPIKEPQELTYIFLAIAIGLGTAAGKPYLTSTVVIAILLFEAFRISRLKEQSSNHVLVIETNLSEAEANLQNYLDLCLIDGRSARVSRMEVENDALTLVVSLLASDTEIQETIQALQSLNPKGRYALHEANPIW
jgi:hypothetical protein